MPLSCRIGSASKNKPVNRQGENDLKKSLSHNKRTGAQFAAVLLDSTLIKRTVLAWKSKKSGPHLEQLHC